MLKIIKPIYNQNCNSHLNSIHKRKKNNRTSDFGIMWLFTFHETVTLPVLWYCVECFKVLNRMMLLLTTRRTHPLYILIYGSLFWQFPSLHQKKNQSKEVIIKSMNAKYFEKTFFCCCLFLCHKWHDIYDLQNRKSFIAFNRIPKKNSFYHCLPPKTITESKVVRLCLKID